MAFICIIRSKEVKVYMQAKVKCREITDTKIIAYLDMQNSLIKQICHHLVPKKTKLNIKTLNQGVIKGQAAIRGCIYRKKVRREA